MVKSLKKYVKLTEEYKCLVENKILGMKRDKFEDNFIFDFNEIRERLDVIPTKLLFIVRYGC